MKIGIVLVATNAYFVLGVRFIQKFLHFYKGNAEIKFYFFSDTDPRDYVSADIEYIHTTHNCWQDGTNSKFSNILSLSNDNKPISCSHLFYFDADTNIDKEFTEEWFIGDLVGGEHFGNRSYMVNKKPYDRNPNSRAYIPYNTKRPQVYYYGAFFGGKTQNLLDFCTILHDNQIADRKINYEPGVNDESYINQFFHYNPPTKVVPSDGFKFLVSDKGGLGETRRTELDTEPIKEAIRLNRNKLFDIQNGKIKWLSP
jgi:hypothetical protein